MRIRDDVSPTVRRSHVAQTSYRIDEQFGAHVSGAQTIHIMPRAVDNARLNINYGGVEIGANVQKKKFVVAHELGHWFTWKWGALGANSYSYGPVGETEDPPCIRLTPRANSP